MAEICVDHKLISASLGRFFDIERYDLPPTINARLKRPSCDINNLYVHYPHELLSKLFSRSVWCVYLDVGFRQNLS